MDEIDKAYIAGFFDGEGCISLRRVYSRGTSSIAGTITIGGSDKNLIKWIHTLIGCGVMVIARHKQKPNWKDIHRIDISQQQGATFIKEIYPYLKLKKRQATLFIELSEIKKQSRSGKKYNETRQEEILLENRKLNKRGN